MENILTQTLEAHQWSKHKKSCGKENNGARIPYMRSKPPLKDATVMNASC
jgi:hypothetical protein